MAPYKYPGRKVLRYCVESVWSSTVMFNDYDEIINDCLVEFASRESEHNWQNRATLCARLSAQLDKTKPSVPKEFYDRIRILMDPFIEAAMSERTNLSKNACQMLGSISTAVGSLINPQMDYLLPKLITLSGSTKKISQTKANETILILCHTAGYSHRLLHHICSAFQEKSKFTRKFAPSWLKTFIHIYQFVLDTDKDYPLIDKAISAGLNDGEKDTRDATRATYWAYAKLEKSTANKIMDNLNPHAATALRADANNPNKSAEPAKPARPASSLSDYKAKRKQEQQQAQAQAQNKVPSQSQPQAIKQSKRNITPMSITSDNFVFGSIERIDAPDGVMVPLPPSPHSRRTGAIHLPTVRKESNKDLPPAPSASFMGQPARRPRVVATPMATQNPAIARPNSKGETSKKAHEHTQRTAVDKKGGRATPNIHEDHDARLASSTSSKASSHMSHNINDSWKTVSSFTRPSSSSSDPAGKQSPKRHAVQPKSIEAIPIRHQKSASATEPQQMHHVNQASKLKNVSAPEENIPAATSQAMQSTHVIDGKENLDVQHYSKSPTAQQEVEPILKARRTLAAITDAMKRGRLDALGYRKLKKLVKTYPGALFTSSEQFNEFYTLLISQIASIDEYRALSRSQRGENTPRRLADFTSSAAYNRVSIIEVAIQALEQYEQYEEPQPGMTLSALLIAYGNHPFAAARTLDQSLRPFQAIETAVHALLNNYLVLRNANAVIDNVLDTILEIEQVVLNNDMVLETPSYMRPPATALDRAQAGVMNPAHFTHDIFSYRSEFGPEEEPEKLPDRLPEIMSMGLHILTRLIRHQAKMKWELPDVQEERLGQFASHCLKTYRSLIKREVMAFCSSLFGVIRDERRFYSLFEKESDRNLVTYCISQSFEPRSWNSSMSGSF